MSARDEMMKTLVDFTSFPGGVADEVLQTLASAGFRILGPDEVDQVTLDKAADYIEGSGGVIPGTVGFASLVSGNRQPCMSGDVRDRLHRHVRRDFDYATASLAAAIRSLKGGRDAQ